MIWIPQKEDCLIWSERQEGISIFYCVDGNDKREFPITFYWQKNGCQEYDPFYLVVKQCVRDIVLQCPSTSCVNFPQLRFNNIIKKWFCCCPSSAIGTKNNDKDEIKSNLIDLKKVSYENGYCDSPIEAILKWNEICAKDYENIAIDNIKNFKKYMEENNLK